MWEPWQEPGGGISNYYARPTPQQLAGHLQSARDWCEINPATAEADALIIYARNEIDESGWIVPTLLEQAEHLKAIQGVLHADPDPDQDGMPDLWEAWHFYSPTNANTTSDADGYRLPDRTEYAAGTDPGDAQSIFAIKDALIGSDDSCVLTWNSETGRVSTGQFSTNLVTGGWAALSGNVTAVTSTTAVTAGVLSAQGFCRIRVQEEN